MDKPEDTALTVIGLKRYYPVEHPTATLDEWKGEVYRNLTTLGYYEWLYSVIQDKHE